MSGEKAPGAFKTIGELSAELGVAQHILRYWESKFPRLRPLQRAGNRRYYRPDDVDLARRINRLLNQEGYTVRGVQKLLQSKDEQLVAPPQPTTDTLPQSPIPPSQLTDIDIARLAAIRESLVAALGE